MAEIAESVFNVSTAASATNPSTTLPQPLTGDLIQDTVSRDTAKPAATPEIPGRPQPTGGRRAKFSPSEDLDIVREVAAAKAHIAPMGQTRQRFEIAASKANASRKFAAEVTWKAFQDLYKRLQSRLDRNERVEAAM